LNVPVLVDSSAWIEVARGPDADGLRTEVERLLSEGRAALSEPVWLELYQGVKGSREEKWLDGLRRLCVWLPFDVPCWQAAADIARACRRRGVNVPTSDILVFACARFHGAELLHRDTHFNLIAQAAPSGP
jgi:predicted nucleic acid-binding protein